jgi:1-acyl-sn-glycerol-3-phosphate acyltransferase
MHPLRRLARFASPADVAWILPPLSLVPLLRAAVGRPLPVPEVTLDDRDPGAVDDLLSGLEWIGRRYFRHRVEGLENVPRAGAALLVGNHSGGFVVADAALIGASLWRAQGRDRAPYSLAHDLFRWMPRLHRQGRRLGVLPADHGHARRALDAGHLLLVFPGGEVDAFRSWGERHQVRFAGRTGYVRLALRAQVPVVPVATSGAHEQFVVLSSGARLAERLGLKRLRAGVAPVAWSLPWGLTSGFLPYVPLPTQITTSFCPPLRWALPPGAADDPAVVRRCADEVEAALQERLTRLAQGRVPVLGRVR